METFFAKLLAALGTEEMLRMPCLIQSGNAFLNEEKMDREKKINTGFPVDGVICSRTSKMAPLQ